MPSSLHHSPSYITPSLLLLFSLPPPPPQSCPQTINHPTLSAQLLPYPLNHPSKPPHTPTHYPTLTLLPHPRHLGQNRSQPRLERPAPTSLGCTLTREAGFTGFVENVRKALRGISTTGFCVFQQGVGMLALVGWVIRERRSGRFQGGGWGAGGLIGWDGGMDG